MIGKTLGHYLITERLGQGGMGVVYKARDTRLERSVALKILPPERVADSERVVRFVQEAKAASALNHPNIITIHDIDSADGLNFMVMEYVAGETLDHAIGQKGLPLRDALHCGIQIADALGKAHSAGIIHRDIKPSNIMLTDDGRVKILDFGLAKLMERTASPQEDGATRTIPVPITGEGQIVGTIAYMSPEQATGGTLDPRSDIFSFGATLYEMVTGRRPFVGDGSPSTLGAILAKEPVSPSSIVSGLPFDLERAVLRCLRKDPQRRWQTMADLKVALQDLEDELDSGKISAAAVDPAEPPRRSRILMLKGALGLILLLAAASTAWWFLRSRDAPVRYEMERLTTDGASAISPAISPDGNLIAYASDRNGSFSLYARQYGSRQAIRLTETRDWYPCFSPDGLKLVYRSEREAGGLYIRDALSGPGGPEMKLVDGGELPRFSPDGTTIAYLVPAALKREARLFVVSAAGGAPRQIHPDLVAVYESAAGGHQPLLWSPDGTHIFFRGQRAGDPRTTGWWIAPVAGGEAAPVEGVPPVPRWYARYVLAWYGEHLFYMEGEPINGATLYRVRLESRPWRATGTPEKLIAYPGISVGASTSARGRMVCSSLTLITNVWSAALPAGKGTTCGQLEPFTTDSNGKGHLTVAAKGSRVAYVSYGPPGQHNVEVRIKDIATGREYLISGSGKWPFLNPVLSPDGSKVAYHDRPERKVLTYVAESGSTSGRVICEGCVFHAFFPDPEEVLVEVDNRLLRQRLDGSGRVLLAESPSYFVGVALSPDGNRLAFSQPLQDGTAALYLTDITRPPSPPDAWKLVAQDRNHVGPPAWSPDGRLLYYLSQRDGAPCVWAQPVDQDGKLAGAATAVLHLHSGNSVQARTMAIGATADRLFVLLTEYKGDIWAVQLDR